MVRSTSLLDRKASGSALLWPVSRPLPGAGPEARSPFGPEGAVRTRGGPARWIAAAGIVAAALLAASCTESSDVMHTAPPNGAQGVDPAAKITVSFSSAMDPETVNLDTFVVSGNIYPDRYVGAISHDEANTIFTFELGPTGSEEPGQEIRTEFYPGETVTVRLTDRIIGANRIPFDGMVFSFTVRGEAAGPEPDRIRVTGSAPREGDPAAAPVPVIRVSFDQPAAQSGVTSGVKVRGSLSGTHAGAFAFAEIANTSTPAARTFAFQLASGDGFLPGETVTVSLSDAIAPPGGQPLSPQAFRFGIAATPLGPAGWDRVEALGAVPDEVLGIAAGELADLGGELQVVAWSREEVAVLAGAGGTPERVATAGPFGGEIRDVALADPDDDGWLEIAVLVDGGSATQVHVLELEAAGRLVPAAGSLPEGADAYELPLVGPTDLAACDLDADGSVDIAIGHAGGVALLEGRQALPADPTGLLGDLLGDLGPQGDPFRFAPDIANGAGAVERLLAAGDLTGNGKPDLVAWTDRGVRLLRNMGNLRFLVSSDALVAAGVELSTEPLVVADIDGDGVLDLAGPMAGAGLPRIAVWSGGRGPGRLGELAPASARVIAPSIAAGPEVGGTAAIAGDLDGDGTAEFAVALSDGPRWILAEIDAGPTYRAIPHDGAAALPGAGALVGLAAADLTGDGALEVLAAGGPGGAVRFSASAAGAAPGAENAFAIPEDRVARDAGGFSVVVTGRIGSSASGVSIALDYDESLLSLDAVDFVPGSGIYRDTAQLSACGPAGSGCAGRAVVDLAFTNGPFRSADFVPLILLRFREAVAPEEVTRTTVALEHGLKDASDRSVDNAVLAIVREGVSVPVRADIEGASVDLVLRPPSIAIAACEAAPGGIGRVAWSAAGGAVFERIEVIAERGGASSTLAVLAGDATELGGIELAHGSTDIRVVGFEAGTGEATSASCELVYVAPPELDPVTRDGNQYRLTWRMPEGLRVDGFRVYVDGVRVFAASGDADAYTWTRPGSDPGTHLFEVRGYIGETESEAGAESATDLYSEGAAIGPPTNLAARPDPADPFGVALTWRNGQGYTAIRVLRDGEIVADRLPGWVVGYVDRGVPPGPHAWRILGLVGEEQSDPSGQVELTVGLPGPGGLACAIAGRDPADGLSLVELRWRNGYAYDELWLERRRGGEAETIGLDPDATAYTDRLDGPSGTYEYAVWGVFASAGESARARCAVEFRSALWLADLPTGVGLESIRIAIHAKAVDRVNGIAFVFRYDPARLIVSTDPAQAVRPAAPGAQVEALDGNGPGVLAARVTGLAIDPGEDRIACEILAATYPNHALYGYRVETLDLDAARIPISLEGASIAYAAGDVPVDPSSATIDVFGRLVLVQAEDAAGEPISEVRAGEPFYAAVYGSFDFDMENLEVTIEFDPGLAACETIERGADVPEEGMFLWNKDDEAAFAHLGWFRPWSELGESEGTLIRAGVNRRLARIAMRALEPPSETDTALLLRVGDQTSLFPILGTYPARREGDDTGAGPKTAHEFVIDGQVLVRTTAVHPPILTGLVPDVGPEAGGTEVRVEGRRFTPDGRVLFGGVELPATFLDAETLIFTTPPGSGEVPVAVRTAAGTSEALTFRFVPPPPEVTSVTPTSGPEEGGTVISIHGAHFTPDTRVEIGGTEVDPEFVDAETLRAATPPGTGRVAIAVENAQGRDVLSDAFEYLHIVPPPAIDAIEPAHGPEVGGTLVAIRGSGFLEGVAVRIGPVELGPASVEFVDAGTLRFRTPAGTGEVEVGVRNPGGDEVVAPTGFAYEPLAIASIGPTSGTICGGESVVLDGAGFGEDLEVVFGALAAEIASIDATGNRATVLAPEAPEGTETVDVVVRSGAAELVRPGGFTYTDPSAPFTRGDVNGRDGVDIADLVVLAQFALGGGEIAASEDAADVNDDGVVHVGDVIYLANYIFDGGPEPLAPFDAPGHDPTPDGIRPCP